MNLNILVEMKEGLEYRYRYPESPLISILIIDIDNTADESLRVHCAHVQPDDRGCARLRPPDCGAEARLHKTWVTLDRRVPC